MAGATFSGANSCPTMTQMSSPNIRQYREYGNEDAQRRFGGHPAPDLDRLCNLYDQRPNSQRIHTPIPSAGCRVRKTLIPGGRVTPRSFDRVSNCYYLYVLACFVLGSDSVASVSSAAFGNSWTITPI
jgi:hypothetical protein